MCGIAGFFELEATTTAGEAVLEQMNRSLAHRGPDGHGLYHREGIGLAHARLAVVDREGGAQPFVSEDGLTAVVLNGEIYNHRELRAELARDGHVFHTRSDTEVLLRMYEAWGERCLDRLRGMFAFAVWSGRTRRLWLVRDRLGIKPLYYYWNGHVLVFGSELKALRHHPAVPRAVDRAALDQYFTFGYVPAPATILSGVRKLEAGHALQVSAEGLRDEMYWDVDFTPDGDRRRRAAPEELRSAMADAVETELFADVPLGVLLSGGLDSTAVLSFMAARRGSGIAAITGTFPGTDDPDRAHALLAAREYGAGWREVEVHGPTPELLDRLAWHFDEPFADPSSVPTYLVCGEARRSVTVCLTGDGGDETFGGYRRYRANEARRAVRRFLAADHAPAVLAAAARIAPEGPWVPKPFRLGPLLRSASSCAHTAYRSEMTIAAPGAKEIVYGAELRRDAREHDPYAGLNAHLDRAREWDSTSQLQYADFKTYLADGILTKVDRASMAHGLEIRVPLLDHALVERVARMPSSWKVEPGRGKTILRRSLRGLVPGPILARRKRGFTPPVARWLHLLFEDRALGPASFISGYLDVPGVRRIWEEQSRAPRHTQLLWAILMLECWGRKFF